MTGTGDDFAVDPQPLRLAEVPGFRTGISACGLTKEGPDIGIILCESQDAVGTALLSKNAVLSASLRVSSPRAASGRLRAAVLNVGNSNCLTGEDGLRVAREAVNKAASGLGVPQEQVLIASCGPIGKSIDSALLERGIEAACKDVSENGRSDFAAVLGSSGGRLRMASVSGRIDGKSFRIAGVARHADPSAPDVTSTLAFILTDVAISPDCLKEVLFSISAKTFGRFILDGGSGVGDTICLLASGRAGNAVIDNVFSAGVFSEALEALGAALVAGTGPNSSLEVSVLGAATERDAELISQNVASSVLLRSALANGNPDWGLVLAAAGRSGVRIDESRLSVRIAGQTVFERGRALPRDASGGPVWGKLELDLGLGSASARAWACGLGGAPAQQVAERSKELERKLAEAESAREALTKELKASESRAEKMVAEAEGLREQLKKAEELRERLEKADKELAGLRNKLDLSEQAREALAKEVAQLREEAKASGKAKELSSKLEKAESARAAAEKELASLKKRLEAADESRAAAAKEVEELRKKLKGLEADLKKAESARESAEKELASLKQRLDGKTKATTEAEEELEKLKAELKRRDEELNRLREAAAEVEHLRAESKRMSARLESVQSEIEQAKVQVSLKDQLVKQLLAESNEYQKLTKEHKELIAKVEALERKAAEAETLRQELKKLKGQA